MKRVSVAVLTFLAVASIASANLLLNNSFETGTGQGGWLPDATVDNWTHWEAGWWADDPGAVYEGSWAIKRWTSGTGMYQDFTAAAGIQYAFSLWAYDDSGDDVLVDRRVDMTVEWYDSGDGPLGSATIDSFGAGTPDTWTELSGNATAPGSAAYGRFVISTEDDGASPAGAVYFDAADVDSVAIPEPVTAIMLTIGMGLIYGIRRRRS